MGKLYFGNENLFKKIQNILLQKVY